MFNYRRQTEPAGHAEFIIAIDDDESTWYALYSDGHYIAAAHWPHPLEHLCPNATVGGTWGYNLPPGLTMSPSGPPTSYHLSMIAAAGGVIPAPAKITHSGGYRIGAPAPILGA